MDTRTYVCSDDMDDPPIDDPMLPRTVAGRALDEAWYPGGGDGLDIAEHAEFTAAIRAIEAEAAADCLRRATRWPDRAWLISHWVGHRCEYVGCRITEQHDHSANEAMREMAPGEDDPTVAAEPPVED